VPQADRDDDHGQQQQQGQRKCARRRRVDALSDMPREVQVIAYEKGMIPYIPADQE
jgi:hypothetical protein